MSYADPQSADIGAGAVSLPRTSAGVGSGEFTSADGTIKLAISHSTTKRNRSVIKLTVYTVSADPLIPSVNVRTTHTVYLVSDAPVNGVTAAQQINNIKALLNLLSASTFAAVTKFVGKEN